MRTTASAVLVPRTRQQHELTRSSNRYRYAISMMMMVHDVLGGAVSRFRGASHSHWKATSVVLFDHEDRWD
jgi:hypothetical protein